MRVLFLSHQAEFIYGGEVVTLAYVAELRKRGVEVHFASPDGPYAEKIRALATWHEIPSVQFGRRLAALPRFLPAWLATRARLKALVREHRIDIVHATSLKAMVYARGLGPPVVWHHHDILPAGFWNDRWLQWLGAKAALTLAPSAATAEALRRAGVPAEVLFNGFDPAAWKPRAMPAKVTTLGFVGELSHRKGADQLPAILQACREKGDFRLWVIGEAQSDPEFGKKIKAALDLETVKLWGRRSDVKQLLQEIDILLVPSRQDPLPTVIVEAGFSGVPVVAAPAGGIPEMVKEGENGFLASSPEEWARAVAELAKLAVWDKTSRRARALAEERYDIAALTSRLLGFYEKIK